MYRYGAPCVPCTAKWEGRYGTQVPTFLFTLSMLCGSYRSTFMASLIRIKLKCFVRKCFGSDYLYADRTSTPVLESNSLVPQVGAYSRYVDFFAHTKTGKKITFTGESTGSCNILLPELHTYRSTIQASKFFLTVYILVGRYGTGTVLNIFLLFIYSYSVLRIRIWIRTYLPFSRIRWVNRYQCSRSRWIPVQIAAWIRIRIRYTYPDPVSQIQL